MADIDIQRKSGGTWWIWLLALLVLALLAWLFLRGGDDEVEPAVIPVDTVTQAAGAVVPADTAGAVGATGAAADPAALSTFLSQCTEIQGAQPADMGAEHRFTADCLEQLRLAMASMVSQQQMAGTDVSNEMRSYELAVQQLRASPDSVTQHANYTRAAAERAGTLMMAMQTAWFSGQTPVETAVADVRRSAESIRPTTPMLEQRDTVKGFFRNAGNALRLMAQRGAGTA